MYQILHALNTVFTEGLGNDSIIAQWDTRTINLTVSALVNEMSYRLEVGFAVSNVGLNDL